LKGNHLTQYVYRFGGGVSEGGQDKTLLGGKGANLDGMASIGLPVPPGFTIATPMCAAYHDGAGSFPAELTPQVESGIASSIWASTM
jgi:pyruvate, orthophosphate dikinase